MIECKAKLNNTRISPKKMRLVVDAIRGLSALEALSRLEVIFKTSAPVISKLLRSAMANAKDRYNVKDEDLIIKNIIVNKGIDLKRWKPAAFGRAHPFRKHSSHVELVVTVKEGVKIVTKEKVKSEIETVDLTKIDKKVISAKNKDDKKIKDVKKEKNTAKQVQSGKLKGNINVKKG